MKILEIKDLKKEYAKRLIFDNLNFTVSENDLVLVKGKSGCGKSSLLNILSFQDWNYKGEVLLLNQNIKHFSLNERSLIRNQMFGFVYQNYGLIANRTVEENIMMPYLYSSNKVDYDWYNEVISLLGISELTSTSVNLLSGGERQRVSIARALILRPRIIFLDEPFSNLDIDNKNILIDLLKKISLLPNTSIILVSHDIPTYLEEKVTVELNLENYNA